MPQFKAAFEACPCGLLIVDSAGRINLVNREIERMFGYSRHELLGQPVEVLIPEEYRRTHPLFLKDYFNRPATRKIGAGRVLYGMRKDGIEVPVEIGLTPVDTDEGLLVVGSVMDISERIQAAHDQQKLEEKLRQSQKMEAIGQLAGGIAHDFNGILQAILGNAEIVKEGITGEELENDVSEIIANVRRGKGIVDRILTFSREQKLTLRSVDMKKQIRESCKFLQSTLPSNVDIRFHVEPGLPRIMADAMTVEQILYNLVNNSVQAMPGGGQVDVALESFYAVDSFVRMQPELNEGWYVRMMVRDTGEGMDKDILDKAFEPFFTTKAPGSGSGLGLSLVHGLVREHGGTGWIESEPGAGTTVSCLFPAVESEDEDYTGEEVSVPYGRNQTIMYVDDESALQTVNRRLLSSLGYEPVMFVDPRRAIDAFRSSGDNFDLAIIDYSMPHVDGIELTRELLAVRPDFPIILVSGSVKGSIAEQSREAGARLLLRKPYTRLELARAMFTMFGEE